MTANPAENSAPGGTESWNELAPGCFAARFQPYDVTIGVVVGDAGCVVIDTRGSLREGRELIDRLGALLGRDGVEVPVIGIVNTHWHYDHCYGNGAFREAYDRVPIYAHQTLPAQLEAHGREVADLLASRSPDDAAAMAETALVPPDRTFGSVRTIDLGSRLVELVHPGRAHTDGDVVVRVPDADVVFVGDLIEQSGPPAYGEDSFPLEWPSALEVVSGLITASSVVVPGHGTVVDQAYVLEQRARISDVSATIQGLWGRGVPEDRALAEGDWPFPADGLRDAVTTGYAAMRAASPGAGSGPGLPVVTP